MQFKVAVPISVIDDTGAEQYRGAVSVSIEAPGAASAAAVFTAALQLACADPQRTLSRLSAEQLAAVRQEDGT